MIAGKNSAASLALLLERAATTVRDENKCRPDGKAEFRAVLHLHSKFKVETEHKLTVTSENASEMTVANIMKWWGPGDYSVRVEIRQRAGTWSQTGYLRFDLKEI